MNKLVYGLAAVALVSTLSGGYLFIATAPAASRSTSTSLYSPTVSSSSTSFAVPDTLNFQVTCEGCSTDKIQYSTYLGTWKANYVHSEYAGAIDTLLSLPSNVLDTPIYGNGTQTFNAGPQARLLGWVIARGSTSGTLTASLRWSNGTVIWQDSTSSAIPLLSPTPLPWAK
jgi:hypothetical protein